MIKKIYKAHEWQIIEESFDASVHEMSESIFSIGNGQMGQRANFEEHYSGHSLQGNYIGGIYYPDKTRVGWWKNGYPEYFAKVLNAPSWIGIDITVDGEQLDLAKNKMLSFTRTLDMQRGILQRSFSVELLNGTVLTIDTERFISLVRTEIAAIKYSIKPSKKSFIEVSSFVDSNVKNTDANYDEVFWNTLSNEIDDTDGVILAETKKTFFTIATGMSSEIHLDSVNQLLNPISKQKNGYLCHFFPVNVDQSQTITVIKYASVTSSLNHEKGLLVKRCKENLASCRILGYNALKEEHVAAWLSKWDESDIKIEGDVEAQQGIRFNIFQLNQTYSGNDTRLNIGPKGFTGEKYGGSTYWDTEAFCLPFYMSTAHQDVAKNLLLYRYKQLGKAIENAQKLGFADGAALYPMVTMNGEECHNEWEITFEEIHRNGAIAFAIFDYVRYTGDEDYLINYGLEVLIAISRFWKQRITFSEAKKKYVMLGVTGPNEYENNVNNNWYTNKLACWTLQYTYETFAMLKQTSAQKLDKLIQKLSFNENELADWKNIVTNMFFPFDEKLGIILQQEGYMDKEQILVSDIPVNQRPINQHWSWDRILRSCFIKQADVVQGLYCLEDQFDTSTIEKNFAFYEARTVHESSLSPCIHSVVASRIKNIDKAYELYLRTARLDLDDYNHEAREGLHITSMSGSWLAIVKGFAGMRIKSDLLYFDPIIPKQWKSYSFRILFRNHVLQVKVNAMQTEFLNESGTDLTIKLKERFVLVPAHQSVIEIL